MLSVPLFSESFRIGLAFERSEMPVHARIIVVNGPVRGAYGAIFLWVNSSASHCVSPFWFVVAVSPSSPRDIVVDGGGVSPLVQCADPRVQFPEILRGYDLEPERKTDFFASARDIVRRADAITGVHVGSFFRRKHLGKAFYRSTHVEQRGYGPIEAGESPCFVVSLFTHFRFLSGFETG